MAKVAKKFQSPITIQVFQRIPDLVLPGHYTNKKLHKLRAKKSPEKPRIKRDQEYETSCLDRWSGFLKSAADTMVASLPSLLSIQ